MLGVIANAAAIVIGGLLGCLLKGGLLDGEKVPRLLLSDFRGGKLGRVTLDDVPDAQEIDGEDA